MNAFFQHEKALIESDKIGPGTRVWAFAHILPGARIGADCNICDGVFIENQVVVGDRVTIKCGVQLWDGVTLEDDVFVGPNVSFTNDPFPRSKRSPVELAGTLVCRGASIGANATILPGLTIGLSAMVGAGAVVTRNVPPYAIVFGNPACINGYVDASGVAKAPPEDAPDEAVRFKKVKGVAIYTMPIISDLRGSISAGEFGENLPFIPRRYFIVFKVPSREVRGEHAHRTCHQLLVCIAGRVSCMVDDGTHREELLLDSPRIGVHIPPMIWSAQYRYSQDAILLVLASEKYSSEDYIRDHAEYLRLAAKS